MREHSPVMIGFRGIGQAERIGALVSICARKLLNVVGVVPVIPGGGIQQDKLFCLQVVNQVGELGVSAKRLFHDVEGSF
ncbi:hypothetical protein FQZ97_1068330 [compost metagenome]